MEFSMRKTISTIALCLLASAWPDSTIAQAQDATTAPALTLENTSATQNTSAPGDTDSTNEADLAKKLQNPVAALISVPFQYNLDLGQGPKNAARQTLNVQPVIPISLNEKWNLIVRTIVPVVYADSTATGVPYAFGLGDTTQSFFFSPKAPTPRGWIWGVGPVFLWPTGTDDVLSSGKWGAGPTALLLRQDKGWTYGVLVNHIWSYAGDSYRQEVNSTFIQPFLAYTFRTSTTVGINAESTYDWRHNQLTIPINVTIAQLLKVGGMPMQFQVGGRYYAEGPPGGPEWGIRFTTTFLFPK
jgi:hypothetical protein